MANRREYHLMRQSVYLTDYQRSMLIGTLLGDGSLVETTSKKNLRLKIEHCDAQRDYVFWKYECLKSFVLTPPKFQIRNRSWMFKTISHPEFTMLGDLFYEKRRKIVPVEIMILLKDPLSLAVWFMDDGSKNRNDGLILNTQCFTNNETKRLKNCLSTNFGIDHISLQRDKSGWRLYVQSASSGHMTQVMKPYVLPCLTYKLISPVETTRRPRRLIS
ncbi:MAG: LAGLIDADG endonuclease [Patescibacteria group bacterium]